MQYGWAECTEWSIWSMRWGLAAQMSHLFGIKYFMLTHLYCKTSFALHTPLYDFLCLDPHCIAFQISYISASDLNRFPRFCKSYVIWMRWVYTMKHMISQMRPGSTNESLFWHKIFYFDSFVLQNLICTAYDFLCLDPHCIAFQILYFCIRFELVSKIL